MNYDTEESVRTVKGESRCFLRQSNCFSSLRKNLLPSSNSGPSFKNESVTRVSELGWKLISIVLPKQLLTVCSYLTPLNTSSTATFRRPYTDRPAGARILDSSLISPAQCTAAVSSALNTDYFQ